MEIVQEICPYNCYCGCGLEVKVKHGEVVSIEGDLKHPYNQGFICSKANSFLLQQHHSQRIGYPLLKDRRKNSWQRISWEEALALIAAKISEIHQKGDYRELYLDKFSGNLGLQSKAIDYLLQSLGSITRVGNSLCYGAGLEGLTYLFGREDMPNPREMAKAKLIILWGVNPVYTAFSQSVYLQQAKDRGAKLIVIDPFYSATASFADEYIAIKPGTDGALALGIAKYLLEQGMIDQDYIQANVIGFEEYKEYLEHLDKQWIAQETGLSWEVITGLAQQYGEQRQGAIWLGYGMQRYSNGGQTVRIIGTLPVLTGQIGNQGGGIYYSQQQGSALINELIQHKLDHSETVNYQNMDWILAGKQPIKLGLFVNTNPVVQFPDSNRVKGFLQKIQFKVAIEHFFTPTAQECDLILPAATFSERDDLLLGYWHKYVGYSKKAISPWKESKSEFAFAKALSLTLKKFDVPNHLLDGINTEEEFLEQFYGGIVQKCNQLKEFNQLKQGGYYLLNTDEWSTSFSTPSGKIELVSPLAEERGHHKLPQYTPPLERTGQYRLITVHSNVFLNSQFSNIDFLSRYQGKEDALYIHPNLAKRHGIKDGGLAKIYNRLDEVTLRVRVVEQMVDHVIVYPQGNKNKKQVINRLIPVTYADMGGKCSGINAIAYHDTFVHLTRV